MFTMLQCNFCPGQLNLCTIQFGLHGTGSLDSFFHGRTIADCQFDGILHHPLQRLVAGHVYEASCHLGKDIDPFDIVIGFDHTDTHGCCAFTLQALVTKFQ